MSDVVEKPAGGLMMKIVALLLMVAAGYAGGYFYSSARGGEEPAVLVTAGADGAAGKTVTSTTTLPGQRVNAFANPNPTLPGIDDKSHSLEEWQGKVIMLNFWATWCPPCQYEIPDFIRFQQEYGASGLQIVGIGIDEMRKLKNFARTEQMNYPVLASDPEKSGTMLSEWGNGEQLLPYTVVIDRDGRITYIQRGEFNQAAFDEFVVPLLTKQASN